MKTAVRVAAVLAVLIVCITHTQAWMRGYPQDDELISQSGAVVVGHLVGSIQPVQLVYAGPGAPIFEYRVRLLVTGVMTGLMPLGETPLIIHYGLRPVALKEHLSIEEQINPKAIEPDDATSPVGIYDCAGWGGGPPSDDMRQDHLWFLRQKVRSIGPAKEDMDAPGIQSPQDLQPMKDRAYYEAVLKGDPTALSAYTTGNTWLAQRARDVQGRLIVKVICRNPDLSARCDQLLALWRKDQGKSIPTIFAFQKILDCGEIIAPKFKPVFEDPAVVDKGAPLSIWMKFGYKPAIPVLIAFLNREHDWWKTRTAADQKYGAIEGPRGGPPFWDPRSVSFRNILNVVGVLTNFRAKEARSAVRAIRDQWKSVSCWPNNDLVGACDQALTDFR
jgi:hypothetical protein